MMEKLTLIIPFKNERGEVRKTLESFLEYAESKVEIVLINDASLDDYDYKLVAEKFNAQYIVHTESMGVAASREDGIKNTYTPYFLILDAHMRAYQKGWDRIILNELQKDHRAIFCCKTICLNQEGKKVSDKIGCGCFLNFFNLTYTWNEFSYSSSTIDIPCIMGASYACCKEYWNLLHGINGLMGYGFDEQFISIKTYLEGGKCKLISSLVFGHIFRKLEEVPYNINNIYFLFNQLYIVELLYPFMEKNNFFVKLKNKYKEGDLYEKAIQILKNSDVNLEKKYYSQIFTQTFYDLVEFNSKFKVHVKHE